MFVYIVLIIFLCLLNFTKHKKFGLFISFVLLLIIGGLRDPEVGSDSANYMNLYKWYGEDLKNTRVEPLYAIIQFVSVVQGWGYEVIQFITMTITLVVLCYVIYKWSEKPIYSVLCYVLLYFYFHSFNITRQYLAIPFILLSFYYLSQNKIKKYFIFVLIGMTAHVTAAVSLVAFFLYRYSISNIKWVYILIVSFAIGITPLGQIVIQMITQALGRYANYSDKTNDFVRESLFSVSRLLINIYAIIFLIWAQKKNFMLSLLSFGVCLLNLLAFQPVGGRICQYFTIMQIFIIPAIPSLVYNREKRKMLSVGSFFYMLAVWVYLITANSAGVVPWKYGNMI